MTASPISTFIRPAHERAKLLKKEKLAKWRSKNREFVNEKKRAWRKRTIEKPN